MLLSGTVSAPYHVFLISLRNLHRKFAKISKAKQIGPLQLKQLQFIYRQHNILCYYEIFTDKDAWSQALYYYALVSIPINVSFVCILIVENLPIQTQLLFVSVTLIHALTGMIPFLTLAHVSKLCHAIRKHIPVMQLQLNQSKHIRMKIKFDDLYERLMFGKKIAFTFGYLGDLTFRGLFEAFMGYIAAFFLTIGFYKKLDQ